MENAVFNEPAGLLHNLPFFLVLSLVVCLSFLTACVAIYLFRHMTQQGRSNFGPPVDLLIPGYKAFLFSDQNLVFATSEGQSLLDDLAGPSSNWDKLRTHLIEKDPGFDQKLNALSEMGTSFLEIVQTDGTTVQEITGRPHRGYLSISIQTWSDEKTRAQSAKGGLPIGPQTALWEMTLPVWSRSKTGSLLWSNETFKDIAGTGQSDFETMPATFLSSDQDPSQITDRRITIQGAAKGDESENWYQLHEQFASDGSIVGYAQNINKTVEVERTLNRFVATLTESFAQLPTGLAIFDTDRRLTIFNPAIADLMRMDPGWLASRPVFRDFMDRVREAQMMPEQKTAADWKKRMQQIEKGAEDGTLSEEWVLSSGQTFNVTGRPHPHGAVALMIEDITNHISLERQHRLEIEQSRATLDFLTEAVCVFDTTGALVHANSASMELWGFETAAREDQSNIVQMTSDWSAACMPTPVWGDLREFVTSSDQRAAWTADVELLDGSKLGAVFAPLPDGSTLATFSPTKDLASKETKPDDLDAQSRAHQEDVLILELAIEHMREAVKMMSKESVSTSQPTTKSSDETIHIEKTVSYADRLLLMRREDGAEEGLDTLTQDLLALLTEKEAQLNISCDAFSEDGHLGADVKRLLINIMLVTRSLVAPRENVDLAVAEMAEGISISCMFKGVPELTKNPEKEAGLTYRIMRRYLEDLEGEGKIDVLDNRDFIKISCTIPTSKPIRHSNLPAQERIIA